MGRKIFSVVIRLAVTGVAFWVIFRMVDITSLRRVLAAAQPGWILAGACLYTIAQFGCIARWKLLAPRHPSLTFFFLTRSFFVATFFNAFLPTTVGGDVARGYDLIKTTGQWQEPLASILMDRLSGMLTLAGFALCASIFFPPAREDPMLRLSLLGFCLFVVAAFGILGSRRLLQASLRPFSRIGLGTLESHAKQLQGVLLNYRHRPKVLAVAFLLSAGLQSGAVGMYAAVAHAVGAHVPLVSLFLIVPIVFAVSQLPLSLNGWGIREGATIFLFSRVGGGEVQALSISLICASIPLLAGAVGGTLFLLKRRRRPSAP